MKSKKMKKCIAAFIAAGTMAVSIAGIQASAATSTRTFYAGGQPVTASVSLGYVSYYGASTSSSSSSVTGRYVLLYGYASDGSTVSNTGYSEYGTASTSVTTGSTFNSGRSYHSADYGSTTGSTNLYF